MKLKLLLLGIALLLTGLIWGSSHDVIKNVSDILIAMKPSWWLFVGLAVAIQLIGHVFRVKRTKIVIDQVKKGSTAEQFNSLASGYVFNALLPVRIGELIRALFISLNLQISFLYTFTAILVERLTDVVVVGFIVIIVSLIFSGHIAVPLLIVTASAIGVAILVLTLIALLVRENRVILGLVWKITGWFNKDLSNNYRFKVWSLIFGLQQFMQKKQAVRKYVSLALASWGCYVISMAVMVASILPQLNTTQIFVTATAPYVAVSAPSGKTYLENYSDTMEPVVTNETGKSNEVTTYIVLSWLILTLPMFVIGLISLPFHKIRKRKTIRATNKGFANKLARQEDLSQEFPAFLDSYFLGHNLSRVLHKIEVAGELSLVKFFKGGSNAITMLALQRDTLFVKKIVPPEYTDRLRNQYLWLKKREKLQKVVKVLDEQMTDTHYAIDLEYRPDNISLFEYVHSRSLKQSTEKLDEVWAYVNKHIYQLKPLKLHTKERDAYIKDRLENKVTQAAKVNEELNAALQAEEIIVNGEHLENFHQVLERIKKHPQAWKDLATYKASTAIHGDLTIDNILVDTAKDEMLLIDPSDDNQIRGPILDFGRHIQSLMYGYEFLNFDDDPVTMHYNDNGVPVINFRDQKSARYMQLQHHVEKNIIPKYLSEEEQRSVLFHVGLFYGRMLAHRVVINSTNVLKYYGVSVKALNEFINQYDTD